MRSLLSPWHARLLTVFKETGRPNIFLTRLIANMHLKVNFYLLLNIFPVPGQKMFKMRLKTSFLGIMQEENEPGIF